MALEAPAWRRRPVALTPLIDVIFLLLLFFMLSSTFTRFAELPLLNAGGGTAAGAPPVFVQLRSADVALNGVAMPIDVLGAAIAEAALGEDNLTVLVSIAEGVTSQRLVDLLGELRRSPDLAVRVLD